MTVSSTVNTSPIYAGNDTTGPWAFSFKTFDQAELEVIKASSAGVETILTLTTEYTVSLNGDQNASPGGEVTTVANVATGESLRVRWVGIPTQETDIQNAGGFYPEVIENALDKLTMLTQRNTEEIGRAVKTTITSGDDPDALVASLLAAEANAAASEAAAAVSAGNASTSETNAAASAASINPTTFVKRDGTQGMQGLLQLDYSTDIASAATVDLGTATGNSVTVTHSSGTTAITSFGGAATVQKGGIVAVIPSISGGTLTVTHHATNMILLGGANITLASGDVLLMMKNHDSNAEWKHVGGWKADGTAWVTSGNVKLAGDTVQVVEATPYTTAGSTATAIPFDTTIPQNTEGAELTTASITPTNASNRLRIECVVPYIDGSTISVVTAALFQDSNADALALGLHRISTASYPSCIYFWHEMAAGTTSATTFKLRAGPSTGTAYFNQRSSGETMGGVGAVRLRITEIQV